MSCPFTKQSLPQPLDLFHDIRQFKCYVFVVFEQLRILFRSRSISFEKGLFQCFSGLAQSVNDMSGDFDIVFELERAGEHRADRLLDELGILIGMVQSEGYGIAVFVLRSALPF